MLKSANNLCTRASKLALMTSPCYIWPSFLFKLSNGIDYHYYCGFPLLVSTDYIGFRNLTHLSCHFSHKGTAFVLQIPFVIFPKETYNHSRNTELMELVMKQQPKIYVKEYILLFDFREDIDPETFP